MQNPQKSAENQPNCQLNSDASKNVGRECFCSKITNFFKKFVKNNRAADAQSGRSMIEMLGVLAIMGILSVCGLYLFTLSMHHHHANQAVDDVERLAVTIYERVAEMQDGSIKSKDFEKNSNYEITAQKVTGKQMRGGAAPEFDGFYVDVKGVLYGECNVMLPKAGDKHEISVIKGGAEYFFDTRTYNKYQLLSIKQNLPKEVCAPVGSENTVTVRFYFNAKTDCEACKVTGDGRDCCAGCMCGLEAPVCNRDVRTSSYGGFTRTQKCCPVGYTLCGGRCLPKCLEGSMCAETCTCDCQKDQNYHCKPVVGGHCAEWNEDSPDDYCPCTKCQPGYKLVGGRCVQDSCTIPQNATNGCVEWNPLGDPDGDGNCPCTRWRCTMPANQVKNAVYDTEAAYTDPNKPCPYVCDRTDPEKPYMLTPNGECVFPDDFLPKKYCTKLTASEKNSATIPTRANYSYKNGNRRPACCKSWNENYFEVVRGQEIQDFYCPCADDSWVDWINADDGDCKCTDQCPPETSKCTTSQLNDRTRAVCNCGYKDEDDCKLPCIVPDNACCTGGFAEGVPVPDGCTEGDCLYCKCKGWAYDGDSNCDASTCTPGPNNTCNCLCDNRGQLDPDPNRIVEKQNILENRVGNQYKCTRCACVNEGCQTKDNLGKNVTVGYVNSNDNPQRCVFNLGLTCDTAVTGTLPDAYGKGECITDIVQLIMMQNASCLASTGSACKCKQCTCKLTVNEDTKHIARCNPVEQYRNHIVTYNDGVDASKCKDVECPITKCRCAPTPIDLRNPTKAYWEETELMNMSAQDLIDNGLTYNADGEGSCGPVNSYCSNNRNAPHYCGPKGDFACKDYGHGWSLKCIRNSLSVPLNDCRWGDKVLCFHDCISITEYGESSKNKFALEHSCSSVSGDHGNRFFVLSEKNIANGVDPARFQEVYDNNKNNASIQASAISELTKHCPPQDVTCAENPLSIFSETAVDGKNVLSEIKALSIKWLKDVGFAYTLTSSYSDSSDAGLVIAGCGFKCPEELACPVPWEQVPPEECIGNCCCLGNSCSMSANTNTTTGITTPFKLSDTEVCIKETQQKKCNTELENQYPGSDYPSKLPDNCCSDTCKICSRTNSYNNVVYSDITSMTAEDLYGDGYLYKNSGSTYTRCNTSKTYLGTGWPECPCVGVCCQQYEIGTSNFSGGDIVEQDLSEWGTDGNTCDSSKAHAPDGTTYKCDGTAPMCPVTKRRCNVGTETYGGKHYETDYDNYLKTLKPKELIDGGYSYDEGATDTTCPHLCPDGYRPKFDPNGSSITSSFNQATDCIIDCKPYVIPKKYNVDTNNTCLEQDVTETPTYGEVTNNGGTIPYCTCKKFLCTRSSSCGGCSSYPSEWEDHLTGNETNYNWWATQTINGTNMKGGTGAFTTKTAPNVPCECCICQSDAVLVDSNGKKVCKRAGCTVLSMSNGYYSYNDTEGNYCLSQNTLGSSDGYCSNGSSVCTLSEGTCCDKYLCIVKDSNGKSRIDGSSVANSDCRYPTLTNGKDAKYRKRATEDPDQPYEKVGFISAIGTVSSDNYAWFDDYGLIKAAQNELCDFTLKSCNSLIPTSKPIGVNAVLAETTKKYCFLAEPADENSNSTMEAVVPDCTPTKYRCKVGTETYNGIDYSDKWEAFIAAKDVSWLDENGYSFTAKDQECPHMCADPYRPAFSNTESVPSNFKRFDDCIIDCVTNGIPDTTTAALIKDTVSGQVYDRNICIRETTKTYTYAEVQARTDKKVPTCECNTWLCTLNNCCGKCKIYPTGWRDHLNGTDADITWWNSQTGYQTKTSEGQACTCCACSNAENVNGVCTIPCEAASNSDNAPTTYSDGNMLVWKSVDYTSNPKADASCNNSCTAPTTCAANICNETKRYLCLESSNFKYSCINGKPTNWKTDIVFLTTNGLIRESKDQLCCTDATAGSCCNSVPPSTYKCVMPSVSCTLENAATVGCTANNTNLHRACVPANDPCSLCPCASGYYEVNGECKTSGTAVVAVGGDTNGLGGCTNMGLCVPAGSTSIPVADAFCKYPITESGSEYGMCKDVGTPAITVTSNGKIWATNFGGIVAGTGMGYKNSRSWCSAVTSILAREQEKKKNTNNGTNVVLMNFDDGGVLARTGDLTCNLLGTIFAGTSGETMKWHWVDDGYSADAIKKGTYGCSICNGVSFATAPGNFTCGNGYTEPTTNLDDVNALCDLGKCAIPNCNSYMTTYGIDMYNPQKYCFCKACDSGYRVHYGETSDCYVEPCNQKVCALGCVWEGNTVLPHTNAVSSDERQQYSHSSVTNLPNTNKFCLFNIAPPESSTKYKCIESTDMYGDVIYTEDPSTGERVSWSNYEQVVVMSGPHKFITLKNLADAERLNWWSAVSWCESQGKDPATDAFIRLATNEDIGRKNNSAFKPNETETSTVAALYGSDSPAVATYYWLADSIGSSDTACQTNAIKTSTVSGEANVEFAYKDMYDRTEATPTLQTFQPLCYAGKCPDKNIIDYCEEYGVDDCKCSKCDKDHKLVIVNQNTSNETRRCDPKSGATCTWPTNMTCSSGCTLSDTPPAGQFCKFEPWSNSNYCTNAICTDGYYCKGVDCGSYKTLDDSYAPLPDRLIINGKEFITIKGTDEAHAFDWFSAKSWCEAQGYSLLKTSDLECSVALLPLGICSGNPSSASAPKGGSVIAGLAGIIRDYYNYYLQDTLQDTWSKEYGSDNTPYYARGYWLDDGEDCCSLSWISINPSNYTNGTAFGYKVNFVRQNYMSSGNYIFPMCVKNSSVTMPDNCYVASANGSTVKCVWCNIGYYSDNGVCTKYPTTAGKDNPYCEIAYPTGICHYCSYGYGWSTTIVSDDSDPEVDSFRAQGRCRVCPNVLPSNDNCKAYGYNVDIYGNKVCYCTTCNDGYVWKSIEGTNVKCCPFVPNCSAYDNDCKCTECSGGTHLTDKGTCVVCDNDDLGECVKVYASTSGTCTCKECYHDADVTYVMTEGKHCCYPIERCNSYTEDCKCAVCTAAYVPGEYANLCCYEDKISHCSLYDSSCEYCSECDTGYKKVSGNLCCPERCGTYNNEYNCDCKTCAGGTLNRSRTRCCAGISNCQVYGENCECIYCGNRRPLLADGTCGTNTCDAISSCTSYDSSCKCNRCNSNSGLVTDGDTTQCKLCVSGTFPDNCIDAIASYAGGKYYCQCRQCASGYGLNSQYRCCARKVGCRSYDENCFCTECETPLYAVTQDNRCCPERKHCVNYDDECLCTKCQSGYEVYYDGCIPTS